jgi:redox-sensing transcriptional repressor
MVIIMDVRKGCTISISNQSLQRMPYYLQYLCQLRNEGIEIVAAPAIAQKLRLNEVLVRKDFSAVSTTKGKPKTGFYVSKLIADMEAYLGYSNVREAVLVGAGSLGKALLSFQGIETCGMDIVMAFDTDDRLVGTEIAGKKILSANKISEMCQRMNIHIGIITVPADQAQIVCDQLVAGGVLGIWNFAMVHLSTPDDILVQNENMAVSLALLSKHLQEKTIK